MISIVILIFAAAIFVEALTEIIVKSPLIETVRVWLGKQSKFISKIVNCGHCFSVWASILPSFMLYKLFWGELSIDILYIFPFMLLIVHRLSNYLHNFNDKYLDKFYSNNYSREVKK